MAAKDDSLTKRGAAVLAATINAFWIDRGHPNVKAERYELPGFDDVWGVRSNLVQGKPPKARGA